MYGHAYKIWKSHSFYFPSETFSKRNRSKNKGRKSSTENRAKSMTQKKDGKETSRKVRTKDPPQEDKCSKKVQREDSEKV